MQTTHINPNVFRSKQHFVVLDGLRGVAAIAIVCFHFMEWIFTDPSQNFIGHGFLAVDFFFCLSGFVIGYAYDDRIRKMGMRAFFKSRFIRLHPLVVLGAVLGLLAFIFDPFTNNLGLYSIGKMILLFICSLLLVPFPVMEDRAFNLFGLNAPAWSLFWEYIANIVYALFLYRLRRYSLSLLLILAAGALIFVGYRAGNLLGGWSGESFWEGGVRISYSFLAGLLIFRSNRIIKNKLGFTGLAILLLLAFVMPHFKWNWLAELFIVLIYFPLLVSLGAGAMVSSTANKICIFSGKISYPLYMTHYAALWIFGNYLTQFQPTKADLWLIVPISTIVLVAFAYLVMVVYDIPIRKYLHNHWRPK